MIATPSEPEQNLRKELAIPEHATVEDVLKMIIDTGCMPFPMQKTVRGEKLYSCPVSRGIFRTVQFDEEQGRMGQAGSNTPMLAVLNGLRRARHMRFDNRERVVVANPSDG